MKKVSTFVITIVFVVSCGRYGGKNAVPYLTQDNLFNPDSVAAFLSFASATQADSSHKLFLNGIDVFRNNRDARAGIFSFIMSLRLYPTASAYYQLGDAYLQADSAALALEAFKMAEKMDYSPFANVLFKEACSYAALGSIDAMEYLKYAIENGFVDRDKIFNDKFLAKYGDDNSWLENAYNEAMAGNGDANAILWQGYSRQFQPATFPVMIDSGTFTSIANPMLISYDYEKYVTEMRDSKFSRDVGNDFFYYAKVVDTTGFKTVIYGAKTYEDDSGPVYYYMASFNSSGRLVDKKIIAGAKAFADLYKVFTMQTGDGFKIDEYKNNYENDPEKNGYQNNPIIKRDFVKTTAYTIDTTGKFIEVVQH